jgi:predicted metal-dependent hydrolase
VKFRNLCLNFANVRAHWSPNAEFAQSQNAASLMPVHVEPYLVKVMMRARKQLGPQHAQLKADIDIFIRQESQHYKQHALFNKALYDEGYDRLPALERELANDYVDFLANRSLKFNCVYCEGFETLGPPNAYAYFNGFGGLLEGADPAVVDLWKWHMAEEFEHRHVCYEVYKALFGQTFFNRYFYRLYGLISVFRHLNAWGAKATAYMIEKDRSTMTPEQIKQSKQRERTYKKKMMVHLFPHLLPALSPFYDPSKKQAPRGMDAFLERIERDHGQAPRTHAPS